LRESVILMITSFIGTNIDDIFIDTLFFAQADGRKKQWAIVIGKYIGIGLLMFAGWLGAYALHAVPQKYISALGIVPIALGIKEWMSGRRNMSGSGNEDDEESLAELQDVSQGLILSVVLITIANGADNLGVYIPLFASYSGIQMAVCVVVFALMIGVWCMFSKRLADLPGLREFLLKYKSVIVPVVFVALGVYIIAGV